MQATAEALRWDLKDLYDGDTDPALAADLAAGQARAEALAAHRGLVSALAPARLRDVLVDYETLLATAWRPAIYASLRFASDTADPGAQSLVARTREAAAHVSTVVKFLDVELKTAPAAAFDAWL